MDDSLNVNITLEDWEWDMVDAEAAATGETRQQVLRGCLAEGLAAWKRGELEIEVTKAIPTLN